MAAHAMQLEAARIAQSLAVTTALPGSGMSAMRRGDPTTRETLLAALALCNLGVLQFMATASLPPLLPG